MVNTDSVMEANDSQQDWVVSRLMLGNMFRSEGPRHTPVQYDLNHIILQHSGFKTKGGDRPLIQLRAEPF